LIHSFTLSEELLLKNPLTFKENAQHVLEILTWPAFPCLAVKMVASFTAQSAVSFPPRKHQPSFITFCGHGKKM
jgi:hypothetical protein